MSFEIPSPLRQFELLRVEPKGKSPVVGPEHVEPPSVIQQWVADGGNYGVRATRTDDLVILDVDHQYLRELAVERLTPTFRVETGSGGEHWYYRCPGCETNRQLSRDGTDYGSLRSVNWYAVGPGSTHPNGEQYERLTTNDVAEIRGGELGGIVDMLGGGGGPSDSSVPDHPARGRVGSRVAVPSGYPSLPAEWPTLRRWLAANDLLGRLSRVSDDSSGDEFAVAKCLAEGGFAPGDIRSALDRRPPSAKWHRRGDDYQRRTVRKAIRAAVTDDYVSFGER